MALNAIVESVEDLAEDLKSEYTKKTIDGKEVYVLDITGVNNHPDVKSLKTALDRQKNDNKDIKKKLDEAEAKLKDIPDEFSMEEWSRLQALDVDDETDEGKAKKKKLNEEHLATVKKQLETKHANELKAVNDAKEEAEARAAAAEKREADAAANTLLTEALNKAGVKPSLVKAAKALHRGYLKTQFDEDDGKLRIFVETDMGEQDVDKYIETWAKSDDGKDFIVAPGGGDSGGKQRAGGGLSTDNPFHKNAWNKTDQAKLKQADPAKADRLAKAAGFKTLELALAARSPIVPDKQ